MAADLRAVMKTHPPDGTADPGRGGNLSVTAEGHIRSVVSGGI